VKGGLWLQMGIQGEELQAQENVGVPRICMVEVKLKCGFDNSTALACLHQGDNYLCLTRSNLIPRTQQGLDFPSVE
jgi:hypothetical protein